MKMPPIGVANLVNDSIASAPRERRDYLGLSQVGEPCERKLWYSYNNYPAEPPSPKALRIFELGHKIEDIVVDMLRGAGLLVHGQQVSVSLYDGKVKGHIDGIIEGLPESSKPHLLEIKSANDKRFKEMVKHGVEKTNPTYWGQVHSYMKLTSHDNCLFVAYNKNTSELYFERIKFDAIEAQYQISKAKRVVTSDQPLEKNESFKCRFCDYKEICDEQKD